jgi:DNA-binding protein H-NS
MRGWGCAFLQASAAAAEAEASEKTDQEAEAEQEEAEARKKEDDERVATLRKSQDAAKERESGEEVCRCSTDINNHKGGKFKPGVGRREYKHRACRRCCGAYK